MLEFILHALRTDPEIAVFLAIAASDFLTGTAIPLDGGYSTQL